MPLWEVPWSSLPEGILACIADRLESHVDFLHFRAVCRSWRSSVPPPPPLPHPPFPFEFTFRDLEDSLRTFTLRQTKIYRLQSPGETRCWIMKVRSPAAPGGKLRLINPFSRLALRYLPDSFRRDINLLNLRVEEISTSINLHCPEGFYDHDFDDVGTRIRKVVMSSNPFSPGGNDYALLAIKGGNLCHLRVGDDNWVLIDCEAAYRDVVSYKDRFFAIDFFGRLVVIDQSSPVMITCDPPPGIYCGEMYFVESRGELFLVVRDLGICMDDIRYEEDYDNFVGEPHAGPLPIKFNVFKLMEGETVVMPISKNGNAVIGPVNYWWREVKNLGDRVLCVSRNSSFSMSVQGGRSNFIYFKDEIESMVGESDDSNEENGQEEDEEEDDELERRDIWVYRLGDGYCGTLAAYTIYPNIFWPPPAWLNSAP